MKYVSSMTSNVHLPDLGNVRMTDFIRPFQRLFTGKIRLLLIIVSLIFMLVMITKALRSSYRPIYNIVETSEANLYLQAEKLLKEKENLEYAVVIDAGSTGSRVHIYNWPPHSGDTRTLLHIQMFKDEKGEDVYERITPGLSSCSNNPENAFDYIYPLIKFALTNVPVNKHRKTPLYILATAGMRLLPNDKQEAIMNNLRENIIKNVSFAFSSNNVQVITGKEEGIYSWIAVNYLLGRFDHTNVNKRQLTVIDINSKLTTRPRTVGMLEMGGASMQIAFEITSKEQLIALQNQYSENELKELLAEFNLGCLSHDDDHNYLLFVTTYLGLGTSEAYDMYIKSLSNYNQKTISSSSSSISSSTISNLINATDHIKTVVNISKVIEDPCLVLNSIKNVTIKNKLSYKNVKVTLKGTGDWDLCERKLTSLLNPDNEKGKNCKQRVKCPITTLKETKISYRNTEFHGFSELWYSMEDVLRLGGNYQYNKLKQAAGDYCKTDWRIVKERKIKKLYPSSNDDRLQSECFKSAWISSVLHDGLKMPKNYHHYQSTLKIKSNQVQWTLGALLFRTRYLPLRAIENNKVVISNDKQGFISTYLNHFIFTLCMIIVFISIIVYLKHLHTMVNNDYSYFINPSDIEPLVSVKIDSP